MAERVAITGLGVVTPIGIGTAAFGAALWAGRSGVRAFATEGLDVRIAGEVDDADGLERWVHPAKQVKLMSRAALFASAAAAMAREDAALGATILEFAELVQRESR